MKTKLLTSLLIVLCLFGCQKNIHADVMTSEAFDFGEANYQNYTLERLYSKQLQGGSAVLSESDVISFINPRLNSEKLTEIQIEIEAHEQLLKSEDYYLCVNEYLPGYEEPPEEVLTGGGIELPKTLVSVKLFNDTDEPYEVLHTDSAGNKHIYWHFGYDYMEIPYWGKRGIEYNDGRVRYFIGKYKECPNIQDELLEEKIRLLSKQKQEGDDAEEETEENDGITLPGESSGFIEYVCTEDSPLKAYDTVADVESGTESEFAPNGIPKGLQVVRTQGLDSTPFIADRNDVRYIRVQVQPDIESESTDEIEGKRFWVGEDFIKQFEDCAAVQTKVYNLCSESNRPYFTTDENIARQEKEGEFTPFQMLYRRYGEYYSKKIYIQSNGTQVVYVPVAESLISRDVKWVDESLLNNDCPLNPEVETDHTSSRGQTCKVFVNDSFPLDHAARLPFYGTSAAHGANRARTSRDHAGVDLYSYYRPSSEQYGRGSGSNDRYGGMVRAINRSEVTGVGTWKHTHYITVASIVTSNRSWIYGEIEGVEFRRGHGLAREAQISRTEDYVRGSKKYTAMLHLELYRKRLNNKNAYRGGGRFRRTSGLENPSCIVEYMSQRKFGKIWEGE